MPSGRTTAVARILSICSSAYAPAAPQRIACSRCTCETDMSRQHWHITGKILAAAITITAVAVIIACALLVHYGLSARARPTLMETAIARGVRHMATPAQMRGARNPVPLFAGVLAEARAHWADHCATV